jgi:AcrR family transcriptional regulator
MDVVAERARVSKATIYRWWPTKESLALDALAHEWAMGTGETRDTGSLRTDLLALLRPWVRLVRTRPYARAIGAFITEMHTNRAFADEYLARLVQPRRDAARLIFQRAIGRGELTADVDIELALDLLYGPLYLRLLQGHGPLNDRYVRDVVDLVLSGLESDTDRRAS